MRTILFKGKRNDNGEWVEGLLIGKHTIARELNESDKECLNPDTWYQAFFVDPSTVCQYIGQTDKNKTNVFEHDRVKHPIRGIGVIKWDDLLSCYYITFENRVSRFSLEKINEYEIIGNIHDKK